MACHQTQKMTFDRNAIRLTLPALADFDALYPDAEQRAIQQSVSFVDVYRGEEFITSINVHKHRDSLNLYESAKEILIPSADFN